MVPGFEGTDCLAKGVLSLSVSADLDGVAGTFNGWAEGVLDISNLKVIQFIFVIYANQRQTCENSL
jgi:hypothetical protein